MPAAHHLLVVRVIGLDEDCRHGGQNPFKVEADQRQVITGARRAPQPFAQEALQRSGLFCAVVKLLPAGLKAH